MTIDNLVNVMGNMLSAGSQIDSSTWQTSAEIIEDILNGSEDVKTNLRSKSSFYTGNFAAYTVKDGDAVLNFGGREANPILNNLEVAYNDLIKNGNYSLNSADITAVRDSVKSGESIEIKLSGLGLRRLDDECAYFEINTENLDKLNQSQRLFAEKIYGTNLKEVMTEFKKSNINTTRVYVLNEDYVKAHAGENGVARVCWLTDLSCKYIFSAEDIGISGGSTVRGVPYLAGGNATETSVQTMYQTFSNATIKELASKAKPKDILKMSKVVIEYLKIRD